MRVNEKEREKEKRGRGAKRERRRKKEGGKEGEERKGPQSWESDLLIFEPYCWGRIESPGWSY